MSALYGAERAFIQPQSRPARSVWHIAGRMRRKSF
jgi:hypothetical protein